MESTTGYTTTAMTSTNSSADVVANILGVTIIIAVILIALGVIVATWKIYKKAGQPGWSSIVPFYNYYILLKMVGRPAWWLAPIMLIPYVNVAFIAIVYYDLGRSFGKSKLFNIFGLVIFSPYGLIKLGFGSDQYMGPAAGPTDGNVVPTVTPQPQPPVQPVAPAAPTPPATPVATTPETPAAPQSSGPVPGQTFGTTTPAEQPPVDSNAKQS